MQHTSSELELLPCLTRNQVLYISVFDNLLQAASILRVQGYAGS
jgi:hypothetical protein